VGATTSLADTFWAWTSEEPGKHVARIKKSIATR
jgi:hypothetical protein